jgi:GTPase Era involved in 16S rRNA processing
MPVAPQTSTASYPTLEKFQQQIQNLESLCARLAQIINEGEQKDASLGVVRNKLDLLCQALKSQEFRVAVIGDFSQGKSTLLNALIGEEIQPTRAVPCSACVSILTYGEEQRIICHYLDGHREEIELQEYRDKSSLDKDLALERLSESIAQNQVKEIIFEHPKLELCKNGVTIIDSPGLNEHPDRSAITEQILSNIDAVIFLTDAQRPLTKSEKDLIEDLQQRLNITSSQNGVDNLFIVVNKWDTLRKDSDRQDVCERVQNICLAHNPIVSSENRIHFLSSMEALDAISSDRDNEYLQQFKVFTSSLESFLTNERGSIKLRESSAKLNLICLEATYTLNRSLKQEPLEVLELKQRKGEIIEKIAHITGRHEKLKIATQDIEVQVLKEMNLSLNNWHTNLHELLNKCSKKWKSTDSSTKGNTKLAIYHGSCCQKDRENQLSQWHSSNLHDKIMSPNLTKLDNLIKESIISFEALSTSRQANDYKTRNSDYSYKGYSAETNGFSFAWKVFGMGAGAAVGYGIVALGSLAVGISLPFLPIIGAGLIAGGFLTGNDDSEEEVKQKIIDAVYQDFSINLEEYKKNLIKEVQQIFEKKSFEVDKISARAISKCDRELNDVEKDIQKSKEEHIAWITDRQQQLEKVIEELSSSRST